MKPAKLALTLMMVVCGALAVQPALAYGHGHGGHWHGGPRVNFGFYVGAPAYWPYYYPAAPYYSYPYPYYPPVVAAPVSPPVYIEQSEAQPSQATPPGESDGYWYYCAAAKTYYPYVKQCAGGWQRVSPQPPPPS